MLFFKYKFLKPINLQWIQGKEGGTFAYVCTCILYTYQLAEEVWCPMLIFYNLFFLFHKLIYWNGVWTPPPPPPFQIRTWGKYLQCIAQLPEINTRVIKWPVFSGVGRFYFWQWRIPVYINERAQLLQRNQPDSDPSPSTFNMGVDWKRVLSYQKK